MYWTCYRQSKMTSKPSFLMILVLIAAHECHAISRRHADEGAEIKVIKLKIWSHSIMNKKKFKCNVNIYFSYRLQRLIWVPRTFLRVTFYYQRALVVESIFGQQFTRKVSGRLRRFHTSFRKTIVCAIVHLFYNQLFYSPLFLIINFSPKWSQHHFGRYESI